MTGLTGKLTNSPDDIAGSKTLEERNSMWGEISGEVVAFDGPTQTATIKPLFKPTYNGKEIEMPNLLEVPVRFVRAGKGGLTHPVEAGNKVVLRPRMRSSENYLTDGGETSSDSRSFNLSDMEAFLDGGESLNDPIQNFDTENMHIRANADGSFGMKLSPDGKVRLDGAEGNIYDLLATVVELLATDRLQINYGSSAGTGHDMQHKAQYEEIAGKLRAMAL